jgi:hypothetical protein
VTGLTAGSGAVLSAVLHQRRRSRYPRDCRWRCPQAPLALSLPATCPWATATTGDVRGTYAPNSAPDAFQGLSASDSSP